MNVLRLLLLIVLAMCLLMPSASGRCVMPGPGIPPVYPPRPPPPPPPPSPPGLDSPGTPGETTPPEEGSGGETTPPDAPPPDVDDGDPAPDPATPRERPSPTSPAGPAAGAGLTRPTSPNGARRPGAVNYAGAWRVWWELSREHLIGLRGTLAGMEPTSGEAVGDPDMRRRLSARAALRDLAVQARDPALRSVALRALGRVGDDEDAGFLFLLMRSKSLPEEVLEGAAIGLASLSTVSDPELRAELRSFFEHVLANEIWLPGRSRLLTILAISLRARDDASLVHALGAMLAKDPGSDNEAAALLYACGLTKDRMLSSELCAALVSGTVAGQKLHDVARAHAAMGLALSAEPGTVAALATALASGKAAEQTRRAAAIALGVLLRNGELEGERLEWARKAVLQAFSADRDPLVQGYCLVAMGTAKEPFGLDVLVKTVDKTGYAAVKPFAAVALGSAARRIDEKTANRVRDLLVTQFEKTRDPELASALTVAVGLSGAVQARDALLARVREERLDPHVRGAAAEALGLLKLGGPEVIEVLTAALDTETHGLVEHAAIALGMIGRTDTARMLVVKMVTTKSRAVREHMVVALSHLGGVTAVEPLLMVLRDKGLKPDVRESAAEALGVLLDPREVDPLFELDAACNPYGLTDATRELIRIY